ncbi:MAG TPA: hypothetical protein PLL06_15005 [Acidobacteriota bacterium]|nr:hypothetical protein [Acidobacteriota bacterium]HMZ81009.1 hypothetical protein [Acidobacteriota bacterium]HNB71180.1 hypothetical protein [Acidobacteriota bacterium]HND20269.1 hypothetical protein [Acidobacteriota bacterium]HNG95152.1 hypothetical protein [Acidobacteriota bacterium]
MAKYDRVIRLRGSLSYEPASKASFGYQLDPEFNLGISLTVRTYLVAEDYSLDEFMAMMKTRAQKEEEVRHFRTTFLIDSRNLPPPEEEPEDEQQSE